MSIKSFEEGVDRFLEGLELRVLNPFGYAPILGSATGSLRGTLGTVQIVTGIGQATLTCLGGVISYPVSSNVARSCFTLARKGVSFAGHGISNVVRGAFEAVPFLPFFTCAPYDFGNRISYLNKL